ncbi:AI-2E family transporter [Synechocystis sp. CACIAM 05]|uniref:AI-2E family transporter n=1 Tax=Synechocystis sp. CACIAM 05 TaxID=1933929 RepID=UPI00138E687A|nr:AI-2E family transporter [Synechocystis sp. CACIAM 05]QHV01599.1 AI-2E family transporter [Synechocystis sp. CACIAM 05]
MNIAPVVDSLSAPAMLEELKQSPPWLRLSLLFPLFFLNGWLIYKAMGFLQPLSSLLVAAALLAFLLDIPVRILVEKGLKRPWAVASVLLIALVVISLFLLIVIPLAIDQLGQLLDNLPGWFRSGNAQLLVLQAWVNEHYANLQVDLQPLISQAIEKLSRILNSFGNQLLGLVGVTISTSINGLILLVLTIFLVLGGETIWDGIFSWFPHPWQRDLQNLIRDTFEGYFATQAILAGILSVAQMVVFTLLQAPYAILFAITIGLSTLIPFASALSIIVISLLLMLENFWLGVKILLAAVIVGQINDNVISPRLMGNRTGLNPAWIIVSLFVGSKLGGVLGLLVAVPLASVIKATSDRLRGLPKKSLEQPAEVSVVST